jgi:3-oxoacyl-[acyl-carrier protein] reductase
VIGTATTDAGAATIAAYSRKPATRAGNQARRCRWRGRGRGAHRCQSRRHRHPVNNAGITRDNLLLRMKDDSGTRSGDQPEADLRLAKGVLRGMMKARHGRIIQIGSVVGAAAIRTGQLRRSEAAVVGFANRSRRKSATGTSRSTVWRPASSTPT